MAHSLAADSAALEGLQEMFDDLDIDRNGRIPHADMVKVRRKRRFPGPPRHTGRRMLSNKIYQNSSKILAQTCTS